MNYLDSGVPQGRILVASHTQCWVLRLQRKHGVRLNSGQKQMLDRFLPSYSKQQTLQRCEVLRPCQCCGTMREKEPLCPGFQDDPFRYPQLLLFICETILKCSSFQWKRWKVVSAQTNYHYPHKTLETQKQNGVCLRTVESHICVQSHEETSGHE